MRGALPWITAVLVVAADRVTKGLVLARLDPGAWVEVMPGFALTHVHNRGIAFSLFVVVIAALNLVLDFDFIESGVEAGAPRYMEWYAAFGLMVTLIWLYLEMLRLLAKLRGGGRR